MHSCSSAGLYDNSHFQKIAPKNGEAFPGFEEARLKDHVANIIKPYYFVLCNSIERIKEYLFQKINIRYTYAYLNQITICWFLTLFAG